MKTALTVLCLSITCLLSGLSPTVAQDKQAIVTHIEGNVYEPQKLEPTDERIGQLKLPPGFRIARFAELSNPRMMAVAPDGTVYISQREPGTLVMLRDVNSDGIADVQKVVAQKQMLHGVAVHDGTIYLATVKEIFAAPIKPDGTLGDLQMLVDDLPDGGQHPNRTLAVGPDGMLYVTVGSSCNVCRETNNEHATILRLNLQTLQRTIYASGLRNTLGFGWHPGSQRLYGMDHGIDWLGDNEQQEELNELVEGGRYGWPYVYADSKLVAHPQPPKEFTKEMWAQMSKEPTLLYTPHSAPMQMAFYTGSQFPDEYRNNAFVAMRGSWNRQPPSGYEVVRVHFDQRGTPVHIEPFLSGFLVSGGASDGKDGHFARLAGLAVAKDGALLVGDDTNGVIYRVSYEKPAQSRTADGTHTPHHAFPRVITSQLPNLQGTARLTVTAPSFAPNAPIPPEHSAYEQNVSPALAWSDVPKQAKSLVLMVEDADATSPKPFVHWLMANMPPTVTALPTGLPDTERPAPLGNALQGANHMSQIGWFGPKPPAGEPPHHYHFQVFALDTTLQLPSGFNRQALLDAMRGHVLASGEVVGTFQREQAETVTAAQK
jgi:Raf kinase inhibitor-like YbhB/YbcL family protein